jgi:hypothetical protein
MNRNSYILTEGVDNECTGCVLMDYCDTVAEALMIDDYMICAEEEDFTKFDHPIYKNNEEKTGDR